MELSGGGGGLYLGFVIGFITSRIVVIIAHQKHHNGKH